MTEFGTIMVSCSRWQEIVSTVNQVKRALPLDMRKQLGEVFSGYLARYGLEGVYERMNGRTVSQILAEFKGEEIKPIASGEKEGVRWFLYDAPPGQSKDGENPAGE